MPELPEVETVRRGLSELLVGLTVKQTEVFDSPNSFPNHQTEVEQFLYGARVTAVRRRAKLLMIDLDSDYSLAIHLKMTGQLVFRAGDNVESLAGPDTKSQRVTLGDSAENLAGPAARSAPENFSDELKTFSGAAPPRVTRSASDYSAGNRAKPSFAGGHPNDSLIGELPDRSTRVAIEFADGSHLYFNDQRRFGWIKLLPTRELPNLPFMQKVGPEPLEDSFTAEDFIARIRRRSGTTIKAAILDQSVLAGVGNIYADESLWGAKIHPATRVGDLSDESLGELLSQIKAVMTLSIEKGGSTDKNYVNAKGEKGSYLEFARVFRREGQNCQRCGQTIEKIRVAGRGTHVCPSCQVVR